MSEVITPVTVIGDSAIGGTATVDSGDVTVVAGNLSAVDIVSNNIDSVVTDANSIDSINTLAASNSQLLNLNSNLSTIETVNSKLGEINRYYTTFLGSSATDPTVRVDGSPLQVGDMYYSTTMPGMKVRGATAWATSAGGVPVNNSTLTGSTSIQNLTVSNAFNANGYAQFNSSDAFKIPSGTTAQRPSPVSGQLRFNITTGEFEGFNGLVWGGIGGTTSGGSAGSTAYVRQTFTATAGQTTFTITGGYTPGKIDVFKNGIKLVNGSTVTVTSGASVVLSVGATAGDIIDVVGLASGYFDSPAIPKRLAFTATAGQTLFTVTGGYTPNQLDVFQNGTKLVTGTDVDVSSGTTFTLVEPATAGDIVEVVGFTAADTISGTLKFHAGTVSAPSITAFEDTDTGVYFPAANTLAVSTNGVQRASIDGSGNTALTGNLAVAGTSTLSGNTSVTGTLGVTSNATVGGTLGVTSNATVGGTLGVTGTSNLANTSITGTITGSTDVVNIGSGQIYKDSSGNVGVGTASPLTKLDVRGVGYVSELNINYGISTDGNAIINGGTNLYLRPQSGSLICETSGAERLRIDSSGNVGIGGTPSALLHIQATSPSLRIQAASGNSGVLDFYRTASVNSGQIASESTNALVFSTNGVGNSGLAERLRIDSSGNVGIGTASPIRKLSVEGGGIGFQDAGGSTSRAISWIDSTTSNSPLQILGNSTTGNCYLSVLTNTFGSAATERLRIDSSGNVGIGTASPATKLTVSGSSGTGSELRVVSTTANTGGKVTLYENTSACWEISAPIGANGPFTVKDIFNNQERLRINSSGSVGIGTTSPTAKLDVSGDAKVSGTLTVGTKVVRSTAISAISPSGTTRTVEFAGIPADVEEVTIILVGLSMSTTDIPYIQLGTAAGYLGVGAYSGGTVYHSNAGINAVEYTNAAFLFNANAVQTYSYYGKYVITEVASSYWHIQGTAQDSLSGRGGGCNYGVNLSVGPLTKVKVEVSAGVFDSGAVYCLY